MAETLANNKKHYNKEICFNFEVQDFILNNQESLAETTEMFRSEETRLSGERLGNIEIVKLFRLNYMVLVFLKGNDDPRVLGNILNWSLFQ